MRYGTPTSGGIHQTAWGPRRTKQRGTRSSRKGDARHAFCRRESRWDPQTHHRAELRHVACRPNPCCVPCVVDIGNELARRTNGAKGERRAAFPTPRNGDRISDGGLCACCRDGFPVGGDGGHALVDCLAPPFSFFFTLCALHLEPRSKAQADEPEMDFLFALAASLTGVTPESIWLASAEAGEPLEGVV